MKEMDIKLGPFIKGMNNRAEEHSLPEATARNIVNMDIDNAGKCRTRKGTGKVYNSLGAKAGFSCPLGSFFVENNSLKKFSPDNVTTAFFGIYGDNIVYFYSNGFLYFCDGIISLKISALGVSKWGMPRPSAPVLSQISGTYVAGVYLASCCWVDQYGVESGASGITSINLANNSGIKFNNIPVNFTDAEFIRLYLSMPDGKELFRIADLVVGTFEYNIAAGRYDNSNVLESLFISPPPVGRIIREYNGRIYIADNTGIVWYSEPFSPDRFNLKSNYILFSDKVDIMEPVKDGIFFAYGNRTDFYQGEPSEGFNIFEKLPYGGVYGTGMEIKNSSNVIWQSQRGTVIGNSSGECKNIQEENVAPDTAESGVSLIKEKNGLRQFIVCLKQAAMPKLAATSFIEMETIRRAT